MAVGGYVSEGGGAKPQWILVGRANWMGKMGLEALRAGLVNAADMGMVMTELETGFSLAGGQLEQPLYFSRHLDVIGIATNEELIQKMTVFISQRGQDSFGLSAKYQDHRSTVDTDDDDLDFFVDSAALHRAQDLSGAWPGGPDASFSASVLGKLISTGLVRDLMGSVIFGKGLTAHLTGTLTSDGMQARQKRLYRQTGFEKQDILDMARLAPRDSGLFFMGQAPLHDLLDVMVENTEEATLELLEGPARDVWGYSDITPLLGDISSALGDRFAFFARSNDYPEDLGDNAPLHNDARVLVWAAVFVVDDEQGLEGLRDRITDNPSLFGLQGREPGAPSVFANEHFGVRSLEYHSQLVPGTGHLATITIHGARGKQYFLISNHNELIRQAFTIYRGKDGASSLSDDTWFQSLVAGGLPAVDMVAWANPKMIGDDMAAIAARDAELDVALAIDWNRERPRIARHVLSENFPDEKYGAVSAANAETFELMVDEAVDLFKQNFVKGNLGLLKQQYKRPFEAAELLHAGFLELALDPKSFRIFNRLILLEDEE